MGPPKGSETGYCLSEGYRKYEHCRCSNVDKIENCQQLCDTEESCKGYSHTLQFKKCLIYTASDCTNNCYKKFQGRNRMIFAGSDKNSNESGCFIKDKGEKISYGYND